MLTPKSKHPTQQLWSQPVIDIQQEANHFRHDSLLPGIYCMYQEKGSIKFGKASVSENDWQNAKFEAFQPSAKLGALLHFW